MASGQEIEAHVYFIQAGDSQAVKIGTTIEPLEKRMRTLQTANHTALRLIGAIDLTRIEHLEADGRVQYAQLARWMESKIHAKFAENRIRGEWFSLTEEFAAYIREVSNVPPPQ